METRWIKPPFSARQGDVLLVDAAYRGDMPADAKPVPLENGRVVLMHGELTGHAHAVEKKKVALFDAGAERFIQIVENGAPLKHEEHDTIALDRSALVNPETGRLQQAFQCEDYGDEVRRVAD